MFMKCQCGMRPEHFCRDDSCLYAATCCLFLCQAARSPPHSSILPLDFIALRAGQLSPCAVCHLICLSYLRWPQASAVAFFLRLLLFPFKTKGCDGRMGGCECCGQVPSELALQSGGVRNGSITMSFPAKFFFCLLLGRKSAV